MHPHSLVRAYNHGLQYRFLEGTSVIERACDLAPAEVDEHAHNVVEVAFLMSCLYCVLLTILFFCTV